MRHLYDHAVSMRAAEELPTPEILVPLRDWGKLTYQTQPAERDCSVNSF